MTVEESKIDLGYLTGILRQLIEIPSPSGYTDSIVHFVGEELERLSIPFELTRRGAIRAALEGEHTTPGRALVAHLDTLGAMVKKLKANGRLELASIGTWSSRFAEGARVTVFTSEGKICRGTILPLKASGHTYDKEIDTQPVGWEHVEVRVDEFSDSADDLLQLGVRVGDYVAIDPNFELSDNGFVNSRHLDNKAGVACLLAAAQALRANGLELSQSCYLLFTIFEEVGSGASSILHGDIAEMVSVDNSTVAPGQNSLEAGITICMMDSSGPFDYHLTQRLIDLCESNGLKYSRDIFNHYRCDAASAVEAGNDIRTALICYGVDGSHGYERTHQFSLFELTKLLTYYIRGEPIVKRDEYDLGPMKGFPTQPLPEISIG
jgi:peptidase M42 family hydrolase